MGTCKTNRPDSRVEATFYVHDVHGTITDSATPLLDQALRRFIKEELEGFGISVKYAPVPTLEDLTSLLEKAERETG